MDLATRRGTRATTGFARWHGACVGLGNEFRTVPPAMPIDDPRHAHLPDDADALPVDAPVRVAPAPARAMFAWAVGQPVATGDADAPAWREFLAPGASDDDAWLDYLRG